jgi:hypothetical protein
VDLLVSPKNIRKGVKGWPSLFGFFVSNEDVGKAEPALVWSSIEVLQTLQPHSQILDYIGKAFQGQNSLA